MQYLTFTKPRMALLLGSIVSLSLLINACQKKGSDDSPTPTYADLSGLYSGTTIITSSTDTISINEDYAVAKISGNKFSLTHVSSGEKIADLTANGNNFTGTGDFKSMKGNLNGNTITVNAEDHDGAKYSFIGNRPATGGNSGTGITVDGVKYKLLFVDCAPSSYNGDPTWEMSASYVQEGGSDNAFVTLVFMDEPGPSTNTIVGVDKVQNVGLEAGEVWAFMSSPGHSTVEATTGTIKLSYSNGNLSADITGVQFDRTLSAGTPVTSPTVSGSVTCQ